MNGGIVYVLTNPAMPGIVKIGKTCRELDNRLNELYSTGVPLPFECAYAARVEDESQVERAFHLAFAPNRVNNKREFFSIKPEQAIGLLGLLAVEDVTPAVQAIAESVDPDSKISSERFKRRKPSMRFSDVGITPGSTLNYIDGDETCVVVSDRQVEYEGERYSLSGLAQTLMQYPRSVRGSAYFTYKGQKLSDIYDELNEED